MAELMERAEQLATLDRLLDEAASGTGRLVVVAGEAGAGKSALVQRFCDSVAASARVLVGYCDPLAAPRPLGPLVDIAPRLGDRVVELLATGERAGLFEATLAGLGGEDRPTALVFEDVQWADESTRDLIRYVGRRLSTTPTLALLTYRDDEVGPQHPMRVVLGDLASSPWVRRVSVPPLSETAVQVLASDSSIDAAALHRDTGGNAFFVTEVLASGAMGTPAAVADAVLARAARLSPNARHTLDAAAVIGPRIEPSLILQVDGVDAVALDECVSVGMLCFTPSVFTFRHELARQAIVSAISAQRCRGLHAEVLRLLRAGGDDPELLARLSDHAEQAGDAQAVLELAPAAAELASGRSAHREAALQYARALRFSDDVALDMRARLLGHYANECQLTSQLPEALASSRAALEIWRQLGDRLHEGETLRLASRTAWGGGTKIEAEEYGRLAVEILETLPPGRELAMAYSNQSQLRMLADDHEGAVILGEMAIALAESLGEEEVVVHALNNVGTSRLRGGDLGGSAVLEESLRRALRGQFEDHAARAFTNLCGSAMERHDCNACGRYLAEGIAYCEEHDLDTYLLLKRTIRALVHFYRARWVDATAEAAAVLTHEGVLGHARCLALVALARSAVRRGADSGTVLDEALHVARDVGQPQVLIPVAVARAEAAWLSGRREDVVAEIAPAYELVSRTKNPWLTGEAAYWLWRSGGLADPPADVGRPYALQMSGDWKGAAAEWTALGCPYEAALALQDSGDEAAIRKALSEFDRLGARPAAAEAARQLRTMGARGIPRGPRPSTSTDIHGLTSREQEVLRLVAEDLTNADIAARLHLSEKTVGHHVSAILAKLGVHTRAQAVRVAGKRRNGEVTSPR